jgi:hypothetical protein
MDYWKVTLEGYGEQDSGDVVTTEGEVIGVWSVDEHDFCSFTPNGLTKPIFTNPLLGPFCTDVAAWHEKNSE